MVTGLFFPRKQPVEFIFYPFQSVGIFDAEIPCVRFPAVCGGNGFEILEREYCYTCARRDC